ncbi:MAG: hypothetical protein WED11_09430 [Natronospirillum sp.]
MNPITATPVNAAALPTDTSHSSASAARVPSSDEGSIANVTATSGSANDTASFSSRSERLAALNDEFHITGGDFKITSGFIERLQELGFINSAETQDLLSRAPESGEESDGSALSELATSLVDIAQAQATDSDLAELLLDSAEALGSLSSTNLQGRKSLEQRLTQALETSPSLGNAELKSVAQARDALAVAGHLAQNSGASAAITSYLNHRS